MKAMKQLTSLAYGLSLAMVAGGALAHDPASAPGTPVCTESNLMAADAQNAPFSNNPGPGRVLEMNITTGERGITVNRPFNTDNIGTDICDNGGVDCPGPWKPTGVLSGGEDGHALITSAAQHAITSFHRDGTPIKTAPTLPTSPSPDGGNYGFVPRLLGSGYMPNGNVAQTVCDANFFNAPNSDTNPDGSNRSNNFFPPVYSTAERGANGRVLVYDQVTLEVIDEYSMPTKGEFANDPRWNCPAGVLFTSEGLFISMFHGDAVFVVDWKDGIEEGRSTGTGSNSVCGGGGKGKHDDDDDDDENCFELGDDENEAKIIRVIDVSNCGDDGCATGLEYNDEPDFDSPNRRDNLRAIRMSEDGTLWGTRRSRSAECAVGDADCNPGVFRQHIFAAAAGEDHRTGSLALDPGVNIIAGTTINRMSGPGCDYVTAEAIANGDPTGDVCDVETLYFGASAVNPGCTLTGPVGANPCFEPRGAAGGGGAILEYRMDAAHLDGASGSCTGNPADGFGPGQGNEGCALPIAVFNFVAQGDGTDDDTSNLPDGVIESIDPRMVMTIHEAFTQ
jgi:hypothetical protein